jgi:hypothetical protein
LIGARVASAKQRGKRECDREGTALHTWEYRAIGAGQQISVLRVCRVSQRARGNYPGCGV